MKFYLISDNDDTQMGMRLAGIEGVVAHTEEEVNSALDKAVADESIAIVLMTEKLIQLSTEIHNRIYDLKLNSSRPLIVEVPDRHGTSKITETINNYIKEAVGIVI